MGVVKKENIPIYLSNTDVKCHPQELGANDTKIISSSISHSKISYTNMSVALHPKEGSRSHRQILLEDGPEGYTKCMR